VLSPDGALVAYTSDQSGNPDVWVIPSTGGGAVNVSNNPATDGQPAWFPDKSAVAFVSDRDGRQGIWTAPALGGGASLLVPDARDPAISPDGRWIAFVRQDSTGTGRVMAAPIGDVAAARMLTGKLERLGEPEEDPAWSPDGRFICYSAYRSLWIIPASGGQARRITQDRQVDIEPVWSADGRSIYFSSTRGGAWALWAVGVDGGRPERVTGGAGPERHPTISADGSRLAFSNFEEDSDVILHDLASGREQKTGSTREESSPALSPDGRLLVYARSAGIRAGTELYTEPVVNGEATHQQLRLSDQPGAVSQPTYSPDGEWIVYQRSLEGNRDIWTIPSGGGEPVRITDDPADDMNPVWSPDGTAVAFLSTRGGAAQVWTVPVKGGHAAGAVRPVTREQNVLECPAWSPDSSLMAYVGHTAGGDEAFVAPADGSGRARQLTTGANAGWLRWDPAGRGLIVAGTWGAGILSLRLADPRAGRVVPFQPPVVIGPAAALRMFNVSADGRTVVFSRPFWSGDLWVAQVRR
jgi:Tol biopolymer transport system component